MIQIIVKIRIICNSGFVTVLTHKHQSDNYFYVFQILLNYQIQGALQLHSNAASNQSNNIIFIFCSCWGWNLEIKCFPLKIEFI